MASTLTVAADAVAVLIGSTPDLAFLPPEVHSALRAGGAPATTYKGVEATHPVFLAVDPFDMQVQAVPNLYALGPLRGDNFARFAVHDGHGVAERLRGQRRHGQQTTREAVTAPPASCDDRGDDVDLSDA